MKLHSCCCLIVRWCCHLPLSQLFQVRQLEQLSSTQASQLESVSETSAKQSKDIRGLKSDKATLVKKLQAVNDEKQLQMGLLEKQDEGEQEQQKKHKRQVQQCAICSWH